MPKPKDETLIDGGPARPRAPWHPPAPLAEFVPPLDEEQEIRPLRRQQDPLTLVVDARVVYLGTHPTKSVILAGGLQEVADPADDAATILVPANASDGFTTYDFARIDRHGRAIKARLTAEGRPWSRCRHIGHLAEFLRMQQDNEPQFLVLAVSEVKSRVERYARILAEQEAHETDRGRPVLAAMGLT